MHEANEMEDFVKNYSSRLKFLELIGLNVARETQTEPAFEQLIRDLAKANTFRNSVFHNSFNGIGQGGPAGFSLIKNKYHEKPEKRGYQVSIGQMREAAEKNFAICTDVQRWVLRVCPDAENSVP